MVWPSATCTAELADRKPPGGRSMPITASRTGGEVSPSRPPSSWACTRASYEPTGRPPSEIWASRRVTRLSTGPPTRATRTS